jgi:hypothetical protein
LTGRTSGGLPNTANNGHHHKETIMSIVDSTTDVGTTKVKTAPAGTAAKKAAKRPGKVKVSKPKAKAKGKAKAKTPAKAKKASPAVKAKKAKGAKRAPGSDVINRVLPNGTEATYSKNGVKTASGAQSYDNGDATAKATRGMSEDELFAYAAKAHANADKDTLSSDFDGCKTIADFEKALRKLPFAKSGNVGTRVMALRNRIRAL